MKKLASLLMWLVLFHSTRIQPGLGQDLAINKFKLAVAQAYNASNSFSQNYYEILGLICPESVYCQTNGEFDSEDAVFRDLVTEGIFDTGDFLQNFDQTTISEARRLIQTNAQYLNMCCKHCSCNTDCRERQNCCPSMELQNAESDGLESTALSTQECVYANIKYYSGSNLYGLAETNGASFFMVNDCASANASADIVNKCKHPYPENPDETTPVYSTDVKKIYKNIFCARCNDVRPVTQAASVVTIGHGVSLTETFRLPSSAHELYKLAVTKPRVYDLRYTFPRNSLKIEDFECVHVPKFFNFKPSQCDADETLDSNQRYLFKRACETKDNIIYTHMNIFKNIFCLLCQLDFTDHKPTCRAFETPDRNDKESFSALLTRSMPESIASPGFKKNINKRCSCAEMFDTSKAVCREILCPPGEVRSECACVPFITNVTGMKIRLHLELQPQRSDGELQNNDLIAITKVLRKIIASKFGPLTSDGQGLFRQRAAEGITTDSLLYVEVLTFREAVVVSEKLQNIYETLRTGFTRKVVGTQIKVSLGRIFDSSIVINSNRADSNGALELLFPELADFKLILSYLLRNSQPLKKLVYCERVKLDDDQSERLYNVTAAAGWSHTNLDYVYWEEDGSMCLEDFEIAFMTDSASGARSFMSPTLKNKFDLTLLGAWPLYCTVFFLWP